MTIRVALADDHKLLLDTLVATLSAVDDIDVLGEATNGHEAVALCARLRPDVLVLDFTMPLLNGIDAAKRVVQRCPNTRVVILTMHSERRFIAAAIEAGVAGYVLKETSVRNLVNAIRTVAGGGICFPEGPGDQVAREPGLSTPLTLREREVLQLISEGLSTKEIASQLLISPKTVETHRRQIMEKTGVFSQTGLVRYALREGIAGLET